MEKPELASNEVAVVAALIHYAGAVLENANGAMEEAKRRDHIVQVEIGQVMRTARVASGIAMSEMAKASRYPSPYLDDLENGKRRWTAEVLTAYETKLKPQTNDNKTRR